MASISSPRFSSPSSQPDQNPRRSLSKNSRFLAPPPSKTLPASSRPSNPSFCRCQNRSDSRSPYDDFIRPRLDSLQDAARNAFKWWNDNLNPYRNPSKDFVGADVAGDGKAKEKDVGDWDWDRWRQHFDEVEEQEKIVSVLKVQI